MILEPKKIKSVTASTFSPDLFVSEHICVPKTFAPLHNLRLQRVIRNTEEDYAQLYETTTTTIILISHTRRLRLSQAEIDKIIRLVL